MNRFRYHDNLDTLGTIPDLLISRARAAGTGEAILAPGRSPLNYGALAELVESTVRALNDAGIGKRDRVAVVLPNGPEMAVSFLAISSGATCAPLNLNYRAAEFDFYLTDLGAKAVVVQQGESSPVREVARERGIRIIELSPRNDAPAGFFTLSLEPGKGAGPEFAEPGDTALVLHTSGTTSRPKIVPLSHANLTSSARHIRDALALTPEDCCLNVMPLFHIHGLIGATLSTMAAGGSIVCTPGFQAPRFFEWFDEFRPTWYTAVPTMHQAILARVADSSPEIVARGRLRFVRSSSASLAPQLMAKLEETFRAPVIESYGMTEASHQMASNPLPPGKRKPGSVGPAAGPALAIMDEAGALLPPGTIGEVVIRGPNVTAGYENNPEANESAFTGGWFRTGDQGYLDEEGYLFLTGRLKELINRSGEKISPREIDEVLLDHPAVEQAVAFALPDDQLGEDVGAAVVLQPGETVSDVELREFAASRLADFKVPRRIVMLDQIPKGPTGKLQRIGLAEKLGLTGPAGKQETGPAGYRAPATASEKLIAGLFQDVLGGERVGAEDNFFHLAGDSVSAGMLLTRLHEATGVELSMVRLFESPTVAELAKWVDSRPASAPAVLDLPADRQAAVVTRTRAVALRSRQPAATGSVLVPIQPRGTLPPLFVIHANDGNVMLYRDLALHLGDDQPVYGLQSRGLDGGALPPASIEEMAAGYLQAVQAVQPRGPYYFAGYCLGAWVALEMAIQAQGAGHEVVFLCSINTDGGWKLVSSLPQSIRYHSANLRPLSGPKKMAYVAARFRRRWEAIRVWAAERAATLSLSVFGSVPLVLRRSFVHGRNVKASRDYRPGVFHGSLVYFQGTGDRRRDPRPFWSTAIDGSIELHQAPGEGIGLLSEPGVTDLARQFRECLRRARERA